MLIELSLLNGLKFYILAFTALNGSDSDFVSKLIGAIILLLYTLLPLLYAFILRKMEKKLKLKETKLKIGKLYKGLKTVNELNQTSKRQLTWLYSPLFLTRRCAFAFLTVFMLDYPNL